MAKVDWDDEGLDLASILNFPDESIESLEVEEWDAFTSQNLGPIPEDFIINPMEIAQTTNMPPTPSCTTPEPYQFEDADGLYIFRDDESDKVQDEGKFRSPDEVQEADTFRSPSPISVLKPHNGIKRKRSKRTRPSRTNPWNSSLPYLYTKRANDAKKAHVRRRNKLLPQSVTNQTIRNSLDTAGILSPSPDYAKPEYAAEPRLTKKCAHCEITKTPQWREGPLGPKTLCNACGVRYRSGRLFPEYRPAASPTFVPSIHSNSHKKVVEMRNRGKHQVDQIERALPPQIEFNPVLNYLFDQTRL